MLKVAQLRSALFIIGIAIAAGRPASAEDLIDVLSAGVPDQVLGVFFPEAFRGGGGPFTGQIVQDDTYGAALYTLAPAIDAIADSIFSEVKNLPVAPGAAVFIYERDPETNEYRRTGDGLGAIYSDRAQTMGKGRLNFGVTWSNIQYDEFEGTSLRNLPVNTVSPNQAMAVTSNFGQLPPGVNATMSILYPENFPDGDPWPTEGLTWNLPGDNTTGTAPCQFQGTTTCAGTVSNAAYHFESFGPNFQPAGPTGEYNLTSSLSTRMNINLHLDVELINIYLGYGVTDRFDIGLVMPFMEIDVGVDVDVQTPTVPSHSTGYQGSLAVCLGDVECLFEEFILAHEEKYQDLNTPGIQPCFRACNSVAGTRNDAFQRTLSDELFRNNIRRLTYSSWGDDGGIGDLLIRGKYKFLENRYIDMAGRVDVSFPTGDEDNFRGTGEYMGAVNLLASKSYGWFAPHVNLGVQLRTGGKENHQFRWALGADARVHKRATVSFDFLGQEDLHHDGIGDTQMAVAPGVKINPWKNFLISTGVLIQVNHQGLRTDVIPTLGVEYVFF